jgi:hypothetical protein
VSTTSAKKSAARLYLVLSSLIFSKNKKILSFFPLYEAKKPSQIFRKEVRKAEMLGRSCFMKNKKIIGKNRDPLPLSKPVANDFSKCKDRLAL